MNSLFWSGDRRSLGIAVVISFLLALSSGVYACSDVEKTALANVVAGVKEEIILEGYSGLDFTFTEVKCKPWPAMREYSILVNPYTYAFSNGRVDGAYLGAVVVVIDSKSGEVTGSLNDRRISEVDAISLKSIFIDAARYRLSDDGVAFGIRFLQANQSSATPLQEEFMNLYIPKGRGFKSVARGLLTSSYSGEGDGWCVFEGGASNSIFVMGTGIAHNMRDIQVVKTDRRISSRQINNGCSRTESVSGSVRVLLKFDGEQYKVPDEIKSSLSL
ncbi:hypothetical protein IB274_14585 [Pseudomonas sp. PDM18]|uniref:hypothetical protein n=1 Tax=Pseudomonas sp. PDM18 TaxID=2769253 RepID=UPI0017871B1C|nr:hypothetical protein [Pseudomonas sp. PDM18]MBD9677937.1 hypothetical protein [Pseudomonas sp. PDM18]